MQEVKKLVKKRVIDDWKARVCVESGGRVLPERLQDWEQFEIAESLREKNIRIDEDAVTMAGKVIAKIERSWRTIDRGWTVFEKRPVIVWLA